MQCPGQITKFQPIHIQLPVVSESLVMSDSHAVTALVGQIRGWYSTLQAPVAYAVEKPLNSLLLLLLSLLLLSAILLPRKFIETLAQGYSSDSTQWELYNEYQHDRV